MIVPWITSTRIAAPMVPIKARTGTRHLSVRVTTRTTTIRPTR